MWLLRCLGQSQGWDWDLQVVWLSLFERNVVQGSNEDDNPRICPICQNHDHQLKPTTLGTIDRLCSDREQKSKIYSWHVWLKSVVWTSKKIDQIWFLFYKVCSKPHTYIWFKIYLTISPAIYGCSIFPCFHCCMVGGAITHLLMSTDSSGSKHGEEDAETIDYMCKQMHL